VTGGSATIHPPTTATSQAAARKAIATSPMTTASPSVLAAVRSQPALSRTIDPHQGVRLTPSKVVLPRTTSTTATVPRRAWRVESPANGIRRVSRPSSRRPTGASAAISPNSTVKASPVCSHLRPKRAAIARTATEYALIA